MIQIRRIGSKVVVDVDHGLAVEDDSRALRFEWEAVRDLHAAGLVAALRREIERRILAARQEEYDRGYKDGRAKRGKNPAWRAVL
jgi:hypothetical protein